MAIVLGRIFIFVLWFLQLKRIVSTTISSLSPLTSGEYWSAVSVSIDNTFACMLLTDLKLHE